MMSDHSKDEMPKPEESKNSTAPVWIFALTLLLIYACGDYFDRHSGWFDAQVYAPYKTSEQLEAYQPKSGAAAPPPNPSFAASARAKNSTSEARSGKR